MRKKYLNRRANSETVVSFRARAEHFQSELRLSSVMVNLGHAAVVPRSNRGRTAVRPQFDLGSTSVRPHSDLGSASV